MQRSVHVLFCSLFLTTFFAAGPVRAEDRSEELRRKRVQSEIGRHGPLDCGNTYIDFRREAQREIESKLKEQGREELFSTPDGRPYPYGGIYIEDLLNLRDLMRIDDPDRKAAWDEEIRQAASAAYERVKKEGLLR